MNALPAPDFRLPSVIGRIAQVISSDRFPTGDRAALRRMTPGQPLPLVFYRFALQHLPEGWDHSEERVLDWVTLVAGIALMSPNAHRGDRPLGKVLAETGYSEARLERLLAAEGNVRRILLLRAARFLAAKGSPCNWVDAAQLLLTRDPQKREQVNRRVARDFYQSAS